jgi:hypothetical protein
MHPPNIIGQRFSKLVVMSRLGSSTQRRATWLCECDCGKTTTAVTTSLRNGTKQSCGCLVFGPGWRVKHGMTKTKIYKVWSSMVQRCENPRAPNYKNYGARGITIYARWRDSFETFLEDMGLPEAGLSLDRIDTDGHYEPSNCRWATDAEQTQNRRVCKLNPERVRQIRERSAAGEQPAVLAREFGVLPQTIRSVVRGERWANVR